MPKSALLILADGQQFEGCTLGATGHCVGEVIFNTSMTGYQEILTDPSYAQQIITLTHPHIGNVGVNREDNESLKIFASGLIVRDYPEHYHNWRGEQNLHQWMVENQCVGISQIDTRALTNHLRQSGSQAACIVSGLDLDADSAHQKALAFGSLKNMDLAQVVSCTTPYEWHDHSWQVDQADKPTDEFHVVVYDFGAKHNILRLLRDRGCRLTIVPATTTAEAVRALKPDGIMLSNGPGDPEPCTYAIEAIQHLLTTGIPIFGICLGHQLLALACGASTEKMKFGHHGANHPVKDLRTNHVMITSQNHGFAVANDPLPDTIEITHRSLFDQTIQGIRHKTLPAFSFQGHPEASPGPHDVRGLFDEFIQLMTRPA